MYYMRIVFGIPYSEICLQLLITFQFVSLIDISYCLVIHLVARHTALIC